MWGAVKAMLRQKFVISTADIRKEKKSQSNNLGYYTKR